MSYITMRSGKVLESKWDAKRVIGSIVRGKKEGKTWVPLEDGTYYRISRIVSVTDEMVDKRLADIFDAVFPRKDSDAE